MLYFFWVDDCTKDVISAGGSAISKILVIKSFAELFFIKHNLRFGLAGLIFLDFDFRMKLYRTGEVSYYKVGEQQGYSR